MRIKEFKNRLFISFISINLLNSVILSGYTKDQNNNMVLVKGGNFSPPYSITKKFVEYPVKDYFIDKLPVTKKEYLDFLISKAEWRKENIPEIFADKNYLLDWNGLVLKPEKYNEAVTYVSWFSAKAYCESKGKRLPTDLEWEYAANESGITDYSWYWKPFGDTFDPVGQDKPNSKGIHNFHNLIWEWTYDYNNSVINTDSRETTGDIQKAEAFCGNTGNFKDNKDYPAFARYSFRGALTAGTTLKSLGFRCAKNYF